MLVYALKYDIKGAVFIGTVKNSVFLRTVTIDELHRWIRIKHTMITEVMALIYRDCWLSTVTISSSGRMINRNSVTKMNLNKMRETVDSMLYSMRLLGRISRIFTEQKWKRYKWIVRNVSIKGNKNVDKQMMYIQVKWLGNASKQMGSSCNQHRRQEHHSNMIGVQFLLSTFWTHTSPCVSHQKSARRAHHKRVWSFRKQCWNMEKSSNFKPGIVINAIPIKKKKKNNADFTAQGQHFFVRKSIWTMFKLFISLA